MHGHIYTTLLQEKIHMCGIFGFLKNKEAELSKDEFKSILDSLFTLSESRGKEAAGLAVRNKNRIQIYKQPLPATQMIRQEGYKGLLNQFDLNEHIFAMGHSRLVTNGSQVSASNNQPVIKNGIVSIHNGIIVNSAKLWQNISTSTQETEIDTEALLGLIADAIKNDVLPIDAVIDAFSQIEGTVSVGIMFDQLDCLILATNTGSLYYCHDQQNSIFVFASERHILRQMIAKNELKGRFTDEDIIQMLPNQGCVCNTQTFAINTFSLDKENKQDFGFNRITKALAIEHCAPDYVNSASSLAVSSFKGVSKTIEDHYHECKKRIDGIRRCTRCILPETMTYITFDKDGVCNYCHNHTKFNYSGKQALQEELDRYKKPDHKQDIVISLSGGRDSCYALHFFKKECGMNPIAYTYDWGMVTDLARRNCARMCGKLGIEHIIVSADIVRKRKNISNNVAAWLKRPNLGTIPLFMAGDKQYFYYANKIKEQTDIDILVMAENKYEKTNFKTGFCHIKEKKQKLSYNISFMDKLKMMGYYGKEFILNPAYINSSLWDSLKGFQAYYTNELHDYINMFDYVPWDEKHVNDTLIHDYNWELANDTKSTWRIGDGTAAFYNYIYYVVAGFTENDTFRSNQIREGVLSREEAMKIVEEENYPRYETINEYCQLIDIPMESALKTINQMKKLYS